MLDDSHPLPSQGRSQSTSVVNASSASLTASEPLAEASNHVRNDDLNQPGHVTDQPPARVFRKVAAMSLILCGLATILMIATGSISEAGSPLLISVVALWAVSKLTITTKRQWSQARFVQKEVRLRNIKKTTLQSPPVVLGRSGSSTTHTPPQGPSISVPGRQQDEAHITAADTSPTFGPPQRQDTEASIGLNALFSQQDGSP